MSSADQAKSLTEMAPSFPKVSAPKSSQSSTFQATAFKNLGEQLKQAKEKSGDIKWTDCKRNTNKFCR